MHLLPLAQGNITGTQFQEIGGDLLQISSIFSTTIDNFSSALDALYLSRINFEGFIDLSLRAFIPLPYVSSWIWLQLRKNKLLVQIGYLSQHKFFVICWKALALNAVWTFKVSQTQHQHKEQRCTKHTMASLCFFPAMEVKPNLKYSSKYLRFLYMATIEIKLS